MCNCIGPNETADSKGDDTAINLVFVFAHQHFQLIFADYIFFCWLGIFQGNVQNLVLYSGIRNPNRGAAGQLCNTAPCWCPHRPNTGPKGQ